MAQKGKIPGPEKYSHPRKNFNDVTKKSKIYTRDRDSSFDDIVKHAKSTPGIGKYDVTKYDEKVNKKCRAAYNLKDERIYPTDEAMYIAKKMPSSMAASDVKLDRVKPRPF